MPFVRRPVHDLPKTAGAKLARILIEYGGSGVYLIAARGALCLFGIVDTLLAHRRGDVRTED
ncbi:MAG: hypothetical protein LBO07_05695 [Coriobacteriales bacterium]|nr:hypothetical protein [Coriobacteriales bacterium]